MERIEGLFESLEGRTLFSGALPSAQSAMAFDSAGVLHVAYYDASESDLKYKTRDTDGNWSAPITIDGTHGAGTSLALSLDSAGHPGIAYYESAHQDLKYAHFDGSAWSAITVDSKNNVGQNPALAYGPGDHPIISYYAVTGKDLKMAAFDGKKWNFKLLDTLGNSGRFSSIAINPINGTWAVGYEATTARQIRVIRQNGKGVLRSVVDKLPASANWVSDPSIAFDSSGHLDVAYSNSAASAIKLATLSGKIWNKSTIIGSGAGNEETLSFVPGSSTPQIIYLDNLGNIHLAQSVNNNWQFLNVGPALSANSSYDPISNSSFYFAGDPNSPDALSIFAAPGNLQAQINGNQVTLTWTDNTLYETGFTVQRSLNGQPFVTVATLYSDTVFYVDSAISEGMSLIYRVRAFDATSNSQYTTSSLVQIAPLAPTGLSAAITKDGVQLNWTNKSAVATAYIVERSIDNGATRQKIATVSANTHSYLDSTAQVGVPYLYYVVATAGGSPSDVAGPTSVNVPALIAPLTLNATIANSAAQAVALSWTDNNSIAQGFKIQRSSDNIHFAIVGTVGPNVLNYIDSGVNELSQYYYRVLPYYFAGDGPSIGSQSITTGISAPGNVTATPTSPSHILLSWTDNSSVNTGYEIWQSGDGVNYPSVTFTTAADTHSLDIGYLTPQTNYYFKIRAITPSGNSSFAFVQAQTLPGIPLGGPTDFTVALSSTLSNSIDLHWSDNSQGENGYRVERSSDGVHFTSLDLLEHDTTSFTDATCFPDLTYWYRVIPFNNSGDGVASSTLNCSMPIAAPTNLHASAVSSSEIDLSWTNVSTTADHLRIECTYNGQTFRVADNLGPAITSYNVANLDAGGTYVFKIYAVRSDSSAGCLPATAITDFTAPTNLTIDSVAGDHIHMTWSDVLNATGYEIQWSTDNVNFTTCATIGADTTDYTAICPQELTTYYFKVRSLGNSTQTPYCDSVSGTTELDAPTDLTAADAGSLQIQLNWVDHSSAATGYIVYVKRDAGPWYSPTTLSAGTTSYLATHDCYCDLLPGVTFQFEVVAITDIATSQPATSDPIAFV